MKRRLPDAKNPILRAMRDRGVWAPDEFDQWLCDRGWDWHALERGEYGASLEESLLIFVFEDPVRWCETFLIEPRTGEPWRFFDYQKESLRSWRQDVVHQDGAEVGKTREIMCMIAWGACTSMGLTVRRPWMLVGAPQQTHLDEIIMAVETQFGAQADGSARGNLLSKFWAKPKRTPHTMHRFITIPLGETEKPGDARVYYRPAGHDGEAFRGVHVNGMLLMDEAAKLKSPLHWSEFWRAGEPGCRKRVYSVPDGDRSTGYFGLTQRAVRDLPENKPGFRLFHWPKSIMPPPYWSDEREAEFVRLFEGRQSAGYKRNVLGEWGEAENPVWSWDQLLPNVCDVPEYRVLKLSADRARGELAIELLRVDLDIVGGRKVGRSVHLVDTHVDLSAFLSDDDDARRAAMRALLREHLDGASRGLFWAGGDLGEMNDPTELRISEQIGPKWRDRLRVQARGLPYYMQRELIYCLQELFGFLPHWGIDLGAAGSAVVRDLQTMDAYADAHFDEVMTGFQFSNAVECIGEDGEALVDAHKDNGEGEAPILRAPAKHWATKCITRRLQETGYAMAYDTEVLNWMTNYTAKEGARWTIYSKKDDHNINALQMQMLRKLYDDTGGYVDVFSSGISLRSAA